MSGRDDGKISFADVLPFLLIGCVVSLFLGGAVWLVLLMKDLPPPQSWNVGSVVRTEPLSNLEEQLDFGVGIGTNGHAVVIPSTSTRMRKQTLVVTDRWQFLVDGQWLLAKGTQLEVRERTAGPQLCVEAVQDCHRFHQSAQLQVNPASDSPDEVSQ
ncbi:hypothetical protein [Ancylobacter oerskovii]|uniref:Uncharacterized protein n=1 Tax=Ancylobacter oerskovii TaxID=459519 RepID=A0ABW4Z5X9_9HYPH|nr:hypothetical protein [Ancylobacter oerskovii]MBS7545546.1 hypothetical protein [Ancylobacter oerskovii]